MVVFTCGHCGESVQKPKVEKHYTTKCRNRNPNLSCMDCFKDFLGNDYESHTKCVTEEERYSGKGFQAKEKKGEKKQNAWVEMLQSVLDEQKGLPSNVLRIIETIRKHNNTPRKKPKFVNFVKNVCGHKTNAKDIDQAWDLIAVKLADLSIVTNPNQNNKKTNGSLEEEPNESSTTLDNDTGKNGEEVAAENEIDEKDQNGHTEEVDSSDKKKLSKKQRKEEKKRKKYEAELQSAEAVPEGEEEPETQTKKGKKKKNKSVSELANDEPAENGEEDGKDKNKKRKRLDTQVQEAIDAAENVPPVPAKDKSLKKKLKVEDEELEESETLHNQNVAKIEELSMKNECFDWHAVIISVLQKKDNEMPFKRLQKKVLSEYMEATGRDVDDRIADKFIKKLKSAPKVRVDKNRVTLEV